MFEFVNSPLGLMLVNMFVGGIASGITLKLRKWFKHSSVSITTNIDKLPSFWKAEAYRLIAITKSMFPDGADALIIKKVSDQLKAVTPPAIDLIIDEVVRQLFYEVKTKSIVPPAGERPLDSGVEVTMERPEK